MLRALQIYPAKLLPTRGGRGCAWVWAAWLFCLTASTGLAQISTENKIKATYLFNFPQFIEWPAEIFPSPASPFVIGILGTDPFGHFLDELVKGEKVGTHPIEVHRYRSVSDADHCQLLYVSASEVNRIPAIIQKLNRKPVLNVGESDIDFARRGGMISFISVGSKVRFRINLEACEASHLKLSSKLLRMADVLPAPARTE
jgi:uncharacterized protein DUF4154